MKKILPILLLFPLALSLNADMAPFPTRHADISAKYNYDTSFFLSIDFLVFVIISIVCVMIGLGIHWIVVHKGKNNTWLRTVVENWYMFIRVFVCIYGCFHVFECLDSKKENA